jgi:hypothetical protein
MCGSRSHTSHVSHRVRSVTWFDDVTQRMYLWPHAQMAVMLPRAPGAPNVTGTCYGVLPSPLDGNASASNWLYSRSAAGIAADPAVPWWTATEEGEDVRVQRMVGTPLGSFFPSSTVWLPDRRKLLAFGALRIYNRTAEGVSACVGLQSFSFGGGAIPPDQCTDVSNDTFVYDLASNTWTTLPVTSAGLPFNTSWLWPNKVADRYSVANPLGIALSLVYVPPRGTVVAMSAANVALGYGPPGFWPSFEFELAAQRWRTFPSSTVSLTYSRNVWAAAAFLPETDEVVSYSGTTWDYYDITPDCGVLTLATGLYWYDARCVYSVGPVWRFQPAAWYDGDGGMLVLGGWSSDVVPGDNIRYAADSGWRLNGADHSWEVWPWQNAAVPAAPFYVANAKTAHDTRNRRSFLWGGVRAVDAETSITCAVPHALCDLSPGPLPLHAFSAGSTATMYYDPTTVHTVTWPPLRQRSVSLSVPLAALCCALGVAGCLGQVALLWRTTKARADAAWVRQQHVRLMRLRSADPHAASERLLSSGADPSAADRLRRIESDGVSPRSAARLARAPAARVWSAHTSDGGSDERSSSRISIATAGMGDPSTPVGPTSPLPVAGTPAAPTQPAVAEVGPKRTFRRVAWTIVSPLTGLAVCVSAWAASAFASDATMAVAVAACGVAALVSVARIWATVSTPMRPYEVPAASAASQTRVMMPEVGWPIALHLVSAAGVLAALLTPRGGSAGSPGALPTRAGSGALIAVQCGTIVCFASHATVLAYIACWHRLLAKARLPTID